MIATRRTMTVSIAAILLLTTAACTGSSDNSKSVFPHSTASSPATSASSSPTHHRHHHRAAAKNPFTGIGPVPKTPTVIVKIDDTPPGRPQVGIDRADVVYIEAVEGGLTRLAAVFGGVKPTHVGYVRSTRPSDPDLFLQYGRITEAYSGGAHDSLPRVHRSGIHSWSNDAGAPFYYRAPHFGDHGYINLMLNVAKVAHHTKSAPARPIGWTFSKSLHGLALRRGKDVRTTVTGSYSSGTPVEFRWVPGIRKYVRYIDGVAQRAQDGHRITATNVIVQQCKIVAHFQDRDVLGNPAQFTFTVGKGPVSVFRNGRRINGNWTRTHLLGGTRLKMANGKTIPLMPGNTWVVLIKRGIRVFG
jgi:hypothetical protein